MRKSSEVQVFTAACTEMAAVWVVAPCNPAEVCRHFRGACCLQHQCAPMTEDASASETSVNIYQTIRRNNPEDSHLYTQDSVHTSLRLDKTIPRFGYQFEVLIMLFSYTQART
jgi:hypothetical protein